jgi:predicted ATP-dependent endonuclease of OLD family
MSTEMKLTKFRVQNYKSIKDSGWVTVDGSVTALVGKNEAGKSALLYALYKLNPVDGEKFDALREFPRGRYTYEFDSEDWPVITACFDIPDQVREELSAEVGADWAPTGVQITRKYSANLDHVFSPSQPPWSITKDKMAEWLAAKASAVRKMTSNEGGEEWAALKQEVTAHLESFVGQVKQLASMYSQPGRTIVSNLITYLSGKITADWTSPILGPLVQELEQIQETTKGKTPFQRAVEIVGQHLPKFIYFEDYSTLDDTLVISRFVQDWKNNPHDSKLRTKMALFKHVNLDPEELHRLGQENGENETVIRQRKDERSIRLSSASRAMTEKFQGWYRQREHSFRYHADNDYFRIWVTDDRSPDEIELANRSKGLQWFYSFYLVFLVEADEGHSNAILLLDEPGLHLHPSAQADLLEYFQSLSEDNQLLYTTHSPFMIDPDNLGRTRVVSEQKDGTTAVSDMVWPKNKEAIFPLQAALGYSLAQTVFAGKRTVVVEGITDYWILKAMNSFLKSLKRAHLSDDIVITPAGGSKEIMHFASLYMANDVEVVTLFDGDAPGRRYAAELQRVLFADGRRIVFVGEPAGKPEAELEDLIPRAQYLAAAAAANPSSIKGRALLLNADEEREPRVVNALTKYSTRVDKSSFQKDLTARRLLDDWTATPPSSLDPGLLSAFERLFGQINSAFDGAATPSLQAPA